MPLVREVVLEFEDFRGFVAEFSKNLSMGGMFVKSDTPKEPGEVFKFKFRLADGYQLIQGRGQVVWKRDVDEGPDRPAGMGVRFLEMDEASRQLIGKMVDEHGRSGGGPIDFLPDDAGVPVAPAGSEEPPWQAPASPGEREVPVRESSSPTLAEILQAPPLEPAAFEVPSLASEAHQGPAEPPPAPARSWAAASAAKPSGRGRRLAGLVTLALVLLGGGLYLFRDRVTEVLGESLADFSVPSIGGGSEPAGEMAGEPATADAEQAGVEAPAGERQARADLTPVAEEGVPGSEPAVTSALERGSFSVIERIEWQRERGGLLVELRADGVVGSADYDVVRLGETESPRVLLRLRGVSRAFPQPRLAVQSPEVLQIRTGYHDEGEVSELHVVFDLAGGQVRLSSVEDGSPVLRLHFRAG